jgi:cytochrome c oxidase subunit 4
MSAVVTESGHIAHDDHPHSDRQYWLVAGFLFLVTVLEVSTYWWPASMSKVTSIAIIVMMIVKFATVAWFFMHLKHDPSVTRNALLVGLILACGVYFATLFAMNFFEDSGVTHYNDPPRQMDQPPPPTDPPPIIRPTTAH